jgi:hypothetical protein
MLRASAFIHHMVPCPWILDSQRSCHGFSLSHHHSRVNGRLDLFTCISRTEILLEARILCVADVLEAMASHRPYRPAIGLDKALEEISDNAGTSYDPDAVNACLTLFRHKGFPFNSQGGRCINRD